MTTCGLRGGEFSIGAMSAGQKRLSRAGSALSSAPYAKADCAQQNPESRLEAVQDYRHRKSETPARVPSPSAFVEERQAQTPYGQIRRGTQDRRSADQDEHAVRLGRPEKPIARAPSCAQSFVPSGAMD